jgi:hypothetical protein
MPCLFLASCMRQAADFPDGLFSAAFVGLPLLAAAF